VSTRDPRKIIVAGDWHGDRGWALKVIWEAKSLPEGDPRVILHLGDFGIWPGHSGERYLRELSWALDQADAVLWFVDGNHEDFSQLAGYPAAPDGLGRVTDRIFHLPRGHRWTWHGRTWLALGGGVSVDKSIRREGRDWWPEEEITGEQERMVIAGGHADVLVSHDCPAGVMHSFAPPPAFWDLRDLARSDAHRDRLQRVVDAVRPSWVLHGHLHRSYQRTRDFGYGPVEVTGLDRERTAGNWAVLDVESVTWDLALGSPS
jgi:Calcineurin-like phosphoesterase